MTAICQVLQYSHAEVETRNSLWLHAYLSRAQEWTLSHSVLEYTGCGRHERRTDVTRCCDRLAVPSTWAVDCRNGRKDMR